MRWKGWERIPLTIKDEAGTLQERTVPAIAPLIISAGRSTDIPAFYKDWFLARLRAGYAVWQSPFGGKPVYVSFQKARIFAFWSKNPEPFLPCTGELDRRGLGYFFLFTLNNYEKEGLEPGIPVLEERIRTFIRLSEKIGHGRVTWRFDPMLLSDTITVDDLLGRIRAIGDRIHPYTRRLAISFIDIRKYAKVQRNLAAAGCSGVREFSDAEIHSLAQGLANLNRKWGLAVTACGERFDLRPYGIGPGQCIGYDLLTTEFSKDPVLMDFFKVPRQQKDRHGKTTITTPSSYFKDPGQRNSCGCIVSKDIGQYSTCPHGCVYCYANDSRALVKRNYERYCRGAEQGIFSESIS